MKNQYSRKINIDKPRSIQRAINFVNIRSETGIASGSMIIIIYTIYYCLLELKPILSLLFRVVATPCLQVLREVRILITAIYLSYLHLSNFLFFKGYPESSVAVTHTTSNVTTSRNKTNLPVRREPVLKMLWLVVLCGEGSLVQRMLSRVSLRCGFDVHERHRR